VSGSCKDRGKTILASVDIAAEDIGVQNDDHAYSLSPACGGQQAMRTAYHSLPLLGRRVGRPGSARGAVYRRLALAVDARL
jgi:hypothetical protein